LKTLHRIRFMVLIHCILLLSGCTHRKNISNPAEVGSDYVIGRTYALKQDVFIFSADFDYSKVRHELNVPGKNQNGPRSIEAYRQGDKRKWRSLKGVIEAGTNLRVTRLELLKAPVIGHFIRVEADILNGEFSGTPVGIKFISNNEYAPVRVPRIVPMVDTNLLEVNRSQ